MAKAKKIGTVILRGSLLFLGVVLLVSFVPPLRAEASGWVEEATEIVANFTKYPLTNYSLDFYVDTSWNWLPWNWGEAIGEGAYYALYLITNVFWMINTMLSYLMGYILEQAFKMDFITQMITQISFNIQEIAGVDKNGLKNTGLLPALAPFLILLTGVYIFYVGMIKRQFTKVIGQVLKFGALFIFGMGFIAYSAEYITKINDFQKGFNEEILEIGKQITFADGGTRNEDGVIAMRENLFDIQIKKPYLLLQYGDSSEKTIGEKRIDKLLKLDPLATNDDRQKVVIDEVKPKDNGGQGNSNMGFQNVPMRLGMVIIVFIANLVIDGAVGIFSAMMITSQVLFILFIYFLPVAFVFALIPNRGRTFVKACEKAFNSIMTKSGVTLILVVVFSISGMVYNMTSNSNFFWMMFLQIVIFVVSVMKMNELFGFMHLSSSDSEAVTGKTRGMASGIVGGAMSYMGLRGLSRRMMRGGQGGQSAGGDQQGQRSQSPQSPQKAGGFRNTMQRVAKKRPNVSAQSLGEAYAGLKNAPDSVKDFAKNKAENMKDVPLNARVKAREARERMNKAKGQFANDFYSGAVNKEIGTNAMRRQVASNRARERREKLMYLNQKNVEPEQVPTHEVTPASHERGGMLHDRFMSQREKDTPRGVRNVQKKNETPRVKQETTKRQARPVIRDRVSKVTRRGFK